MMSCLLSHKREEEQVSIRCKTTVNSNQSQSCLWSHTDVLPVLLVSPEREKAEYQAVDTRGDTQFSSSTDIPSLENTQAHHQWRAGEKRLLLKSQHINLLKKILLSSVKSCLYFSTFLEIYYNIALFFQSVSFFCERAELLIRWLL